MSLAIYGFIFEKGDFCEGSEANIIFGFFKSFFVIFSKRGFRDSLLNLFKGGRG